MLLLVRDRQDIHADQSHLCHDCRSVPKFSILTFFRGRRRRLFKEGPSTSSTKAKRNSAPTPSAALPQFSKGVKILPCMWVQGPFGDAHTRVSFVPNNHVHAYVANAILRYNQDKRREEAGGLPEYDLTDASSGGRMFPLQRRCQPL